MKKVYFYVVSLCMSLMFFGCQHRVQVRSTSLGVGDDVQKPIYFGFGRWALSPQEEEALSQKARVLKAHPEATILLEGHTDPIGDDEGNLELGDRRARYIKWKLSQEGVSPERVVVTSYGESQADNRDLSENTRQKERRVELKVK